MNSNYIYKISTPSNLCYYGSTTKNIYYRMVEHINSYKSYKNKAKVGYCYSYKLFDEAGIENCKIEIVERVENITNLLKRENYYINNYECVNKRSKVIKHSKIDIISCMLIKRIKYTNKLIVFTDVLTLNKMNIYNLELKQEAFLLTAELYSKCSKEFNISSTIPTTQKKFLILLKHMYESLFTKDVLTTTQYKKTDINNKRVRYYKYVINHELLKTYPLLISI